MANRLRGIADDMLGPDRLPSVDEMADRTGIPRATLYYYFSGREELVDFLLLDKVEQVGAAVRSAVSDISDPVINLETVLSTALRTMAAHPTLCTILISRLPALAPTDPLAVSVDRAVVVPMRDLLEAGAASGSFIFSHADVTAHALYGAVSMAALSRFARDGHIDADELVAALVPRLMSSVATR